MAVVLGHAQAAHGAVFDHLADLRPGDEVDLVDASGAVLHLKVLKNPVTGLDKSTSALADALNGHPADADLALVTCGGDFDRAAGASEDNEVVFASVV
jgi:sortase (surface protein transpeptidase)